MNVEVPSAPIADNAWKCRWATCVPSRPMYNAASNNLLTVGEAFVVTWSFEILPDAVQPFLGGGQVAERNRRMVYCRGE